MYSYERPSFIHHRLWLWEIGRRMREARVGGKVSRPNASRCKVFVWCRVNYGLLCYLLLKTVKNYFERVSKKEYNFKILFKRVDWYLTVNSLGRRTSIYMLYNLSYFRRIVNEKENQNGKKIVLIKSYRNKQYSKNKKRESFATIWWCTTVCRFEFSARNALITK